MRRLTIRRLMLWVAVLAAIFGFLDLSRRSGREARFRARMAQCTNNLKQITFALHAYHTDFGCFPPAYLADASGKPMHSWRVLILPYLEQQALYDAYNFAEPWDGPNNRKLAAEIPGFFLCPSRPNPNPTSTSYLAITGPGTAFPGAGTARLTDLASSQHRMILVGEVADAPVNWMEPRDLDVRTLGLAAQGAPPPSLSSFDLDGPAVGLMDDPSDPMYGRLNSRVERLDPDTPTAELRARATLSP